MRSAYFLVILIALQVSSKGVSHEDCVYTLYVKTWSVIKAGTNSKITITLGDSAGRSLRVPDLESWGLMGPKHDYYERGNLDIFSIRGPCIGAPVCSLNLTSDGSGWNHSWYCKYIELNATGPRRSCGQSVLYVDQWLSRDVPPYQLSVVLDGCKRPQGGPVLPLQRIETRRLMGHLPKS